MHEEGQDVNGDSARHGKSYIGSVSIICMSRYTLLRGFPPVTVLHNYGVLQYSCGLSFYSCGVSFYSTHCTISLSYQ